MTRLASLFLPQLPIERLRRLERPAKPREPRTGASPVLVPPIGEHPGACSVPRGGSWRPGARGARDGAPTKAQIAAQVARLPSHQRPPMREMGRRSEQAGHPFKAMPLDEGRPSATLIQTPRWRIGRPAVLIERVGQAYVGARPEMKGLLPTEVAIAKPPQL